MSDDLPAPRRVTAARSRASLAGSGGDIQILQATGVGMIDDYQGVIRFPGSEREFSWPVADLTRMPPKS